MDTIKEIQERIVEEFSMYDEWLDKYEYLIELGKSLEPLEDRRQADKRMSVASMARHKRPAGQNPRFQG